MSSPTQRSLALCKRNGYLAAVVEKWNPAVKIRHDLFGCIDILAVAPDLICGIQTTSMSNMANRVAKAVAEPRLVDWLRAGGRFFVHGWAKKGKRGARKTWQVVEKELVLYRCGNYPYRVVEK